MQIHDLKKMSKWATRRISSQEESLWDWYQLVKLREALDCLIQSYDFQTKTIPEYLPPQIPRKSTRPKLAIDNDRQDNTQHYPGSPKNLQP